MLNTDYTRLSCGTRLRCAILVPMICSLMGFYSTPLPVQANKCEIVIHTTLSLNACFLMSSKPLHNAQNTPFQLTPLEDCALPYNMSPEQICADTTVSRTFQPAQRNTHMQTARSHSKGCYLVLGLGAYSSGLGHPHGFMSPYPAVSTFNPKPYALNPKSYLLLVGWLAFWALGASRRHTLYT